MSKRLYGHCEELERLVQQLLLARTEGLGPRELAAFVDGWSSMLELVGRSDLSLPDAAPELRAGLCDVVAAIRRAQARVLDDEDP